jgi:hypothetical protein
MIGEKLLQEPKNFEDIVEIFTYFNMSLGGEGVDDEDNAKRLVELNNEVYERLNRDCTKCSYYNYSYEDHPCKDCYKNKSDKFEAPT